MESNCRFAAKREGGGFLRLRRKENRIFSVNLLCEKHFVYLWLSSKANRYGYFFERTTGNAGKRE